MWLRALTMTGVLATSSAYAGDGVDAGIDRRLTPLIDAPPPAPLPPGTARLGTARAMKPTGSLVVTGSLDRALVARVLRAQQRLFAECATLHRADGSGVGASVLTFDVRPDGTTAVVSVTAANAGLSTCLAEVMRQAVFPRPPGGDVVHVEAPLSL